MRALERSTASSGAADQDGRRAASVAGRVASATNRCERASQSRWTRGAAVLARTQLPAGFLLLRAVDARPQSIAGRLGRWRLGRAGWHEECQSGKNPACELSQWQTSVRQRIRPEGCGVGARFRCCEGMCAGSSRSNVLQWHRLLHPFSDPLQSRLSRTCPRPPPPGARARRARVDRASTECDRGHPW
jgi:hypothetical protein